MTGVFVKRVALRAQRTDDEAEALRIVSSGVSVKAAAEALGVSTSTVRARIARALAKLPDPDAPAYRAQMAFEIAQVKDAAWAIAQNPPFIVSAGKVTSQRDAAAVTGALQTVLKAMERQAKLFGLDAPNRQMVQVVDNRALDEAIAEVERQLDLTVDGTVDDASNTGEDHRRSRQDRAVRGASAGAGAAEGGAA